MGKRRSDNRAGPSLPSAGDWVLIGHGQYSEPQHWWIAECQWSDGASSFLVPYLQGMGADGSPYIADHHAFVTYGTREHCEAVWQAVIEARRPLAERFYRASRELTAAKDAILDATIAAAKDAGGKCPGGRVG